jgi:hypothetical protein
MKTYPYGSILRCENKTLGKRVTALVLEDKIRILRLNNETWGTRTLPTLRDISEFNNWIQELFDVTRMTVEIRSGGSNPKKTTSLPLPSPVATGPQPGNIVRGFTNGDIRITALVGNDNRVRILRIGSKTWASFPNRMDQYVFNSYADLLKSYPLTRVEIERR